MPGLWEGIIPLPENHIVQDLNTHLPWKNINNNIYQKLKWYNSCKYATPLFIVLKNTIIS